MTPARAKELLDKGILQAYAEGKVLEYEYCGRWLKLISYPDFSNERITWRIKPEPREAWIVVRDGYSVEDAALFGSEDRAKDFLKRHINIGRIVHMREVQ